MLALGNTVRIDGSGFESGTTVKIDGLSIASTQLVSPQRINVTLGAPADLSARRITIQNPDRTSVTYFSALHGPVIHRPADGSLPNVQPIFPQQLYPAGNAGMFLFDATTAVALQNPALNPVDVTIESNSTFVTGSVIVPTLVTIPPGGVYLERGQFLGANSQRAYVVVIPAAPIQMALVNVGRAALMTPTTVLRTVVNVAADNGQYGEVLDDDSPLVFHWAVGSPAPKPQVVDMIYNSTPPVTFTASSATQMGGPWLSISPTQGTTCSSYIATGSASACPAASKVTVAVDPTHLGPGTYQGTITVTSKGLNPVPSVVPIVLSVEAQTQIFLILPPGDFNDFPSAPTDPVQSRSIQVISNADPQPFSVAVTTQSGQNWLTATPQQGSTPATIQISANPAAFHGTNDAGTITITGPFKTVTLPITLELVTYTAPPSVLTTMPLAVQFSVQTGQPAPAPQPVGVSTFAPITVAVQTTDGGKWLSATGGQPVPQGLVVSVDPTGLAPGTYHGIVTISSTAAPAPAQLPVTLTVWSAPPPPLTVSPSSLTLTAISGGPAIIQTVNTATGNIPISFGTAGASTTDGGDWLSLVAVPQLPPIPLITSGPATIAANPANLAPGVYHGTLTIAAPPGSSNTATVSVTLTVTGTPPVLPQQGTIPLVSALVNAASQAPGSLSPGEIITLFGQNIGPATPYYFTLGSDGKASTDLGGAQVLFDGIAAPLIYASATQINAIVPYETAGRAIINISASFNGANIPAGGVAVTDASPAIFTITSSGQGGAAVLNQDNSLNTSMNPAPTSSIVQIFATGHGLTSPPGVTGEITGPPSKAPVLPVHVLIGGIDAQVISAVSAPEEVSGMLQVNAVVPTDVVPGSIAPMIVKIGTEQSQAGVTIAVK